jgi:hypothetical protein
LGIAKKIWGLVEKKLSSGNSVNQIVSLFFLI